MEISEIIVKQYTTQDFRVMFATLQFEKKVMNYKVSIYLIALYLCVKKQAEWTKAGEILYKKHKISLIIQYQ